MAVLLNASNDDFIRTTEKRHHEASQDIWNRMGEAGDLYKDSYAGWYSVRDEAYYQENETELRADGVRYGPQGTPVEWVEEQSYFFKLSEYQDKLLKHYEENPDFIGPAERRNEVISFVKSGLKDLSVSRTTFDWGIKVPNDPGHVMYVWVDALTNYITATGYLDRSAGTAGEILAGEHAYHRQGHHPLSRGLLARFPDVGRPAAAQARLRPRLPAQQGREDVEVARQRRRSVQSRRAFRSRPDPLLLPARGFLRPGRQATARRGSQPASTADLANGIGNLAQPFVVDDRQELRWPYSCLRLR